MELFLIRHGETDWNKDGRIQGWIDVGLNDKGRSQAKETAGELPDRRFELYSSSLRRATETVDILADYLSMRGRQHLDDLRELNQGYWNGLRGDWLSQQNYDTYRGWLDKPTRYVPPRGESLQDVRDRVSDALNLIENEAEEPVLIVAHKVVNSMIMHLLADRDFKDVLDDLPENAQVQRITLNTN